MTPADGWRRSAAPRLRRVGVLGGMGPEATIHFMARVLALTPAEDDADHVPLVVDQNTQVPSRIAALIEGGGSDPAPALADMARRLAAAGAEALAMPCNTAHHYASAIIGATDLPFLNMVALTAARLAADGCRTVGVLASPAVKITGVYDRVFAPAGVAAVYPADQQRLLAAIRAIKAGRDGDMARRTVREAGEEVAAAGADAALIACTEFSTVAQALPPGLPALDSIEVLAAAVVAFARTHLDVDVAQSALGSTLLPLDQSCEADNCHRDN
ncbi:MAG: aspartate/glutamate racemase family protein [Rhodospirillaceae bacterium]|nr:aspartate/glutamate racemase family protein [Rhodospirillaceae bacterium]